MTRPADPPAVDRADHPVPRLLVIMGSGETAPTMVKVHRTVFDRAGPGPAVLLDTPYGFQTNAEDISRRAQRYFADSVGRRVEVVSWRRDPGPGAEQERALAELRGARWVFAGPGSPTYALRQWRDTPLPATLAGLLAHGGVVLFASAAALTLSAFTVPVYEIYKAGEQPRWEPGLDLFTAATGLPAVVIPHFNNAEGGNHDTRYCYLGERRLSMMEDELPAETFVLGVDEHTACLLDLDARTAQVLGTGVVTVRRHGRSRTFDSGRTVGFDQLAAADAGTDATGTAVGGQRVPAGRDRPAAGEPGGPEPPPLLAAARACEAAFRAALRAADVDAAAEAVLELEQTLAAWATDTSDEREPARRVLRAMVLELADRARTGLADPRDAVAPYVEALLELRGLAREQRDFGTADLVRDRLTAAGVEVRDTPEGPRWLLGGGPAAGPR
jgi:cyanophycinase-like exopeptidase